MLEQNRKDIEADLFSLSDGAFRYDDREKILLLARERERAGELKMCAVFYGRLFRAL